MYTSSNTTIISVTDATPTTARDGEAPISTNTCTAGSDSSTAVSGLGVLVGLLLILLAVSVIVNVLLLYIGKFVTQYN